MEFNSGFKGLSERFPKFWRLYIPSKHQEPSIQW